MRFTMTMGRAVRVVTALVVALLIGFLFLPAALGQARAPVVPIMMVPGLLTIVLVLTILWAPRAVRLEDEHLVIERLLWPEFRIPLRDLARVEAGPQLHLVGRTVLRVAGNGGLMGFTGLFWVNGVGVVRMWATQLGTPTVLLWRHQARPIVLGVDDAAGLLSALERRLPCGSP